jgi:hypothetical protein
MHTTPFRILKYISLETTKQLKVFVSKKED